MGGGKETPRQKLIGLMYLVLMALLAMNVSKSILNAFITVNDKFERAAELTHGTTDGMMGKMDMQLATLASANAPKEEVAKIEAIKGKAEEIRKLSRSTANFYVSECSRMILASDETMPDPFYTIEGEGDWTYFTLMGMDTLSKKDDYDTAPHLYLKEGTHDPSDAGLAIENRLISFRDSLLVMAATFTHDNGKTYTIDPSNIVRPENNQHMDGYNTSVEEMLETVNPEDRDRVKRICDLLSVPEKVGNHGEMYPWIAYQFDHAVIVAAATMFTALKNDVKMAEQIAIEMVSSRAKVETFNFNKIDALAFGSTGYINQGDSLNLSVMIAAYDSTENMELRYWVDDTLKAGKPIEFTGEAGEKLRMGGGVGAHTIVGEIMVKEKGNKKWKPWQFEYSVGAPNAAVAAADLAVLYRGWDNRIKVSASGYDPSSVSVSCKGCKGSLSKSGEFYIAKAGNGKEATITVSAKTADGKSVSLAAEKFRIFPLPKPQPYFAGQTFTKPTMKKGTATNASQIKAKLGDSPLNVQYTVTGFKMIVAKNGKIAEVSSKSGKLTGEMKAAIKKMPKGTSLTFVGISAKSAGGGKSTPIGGLSFKLI